ncbi:MAG TPA: NADH-quinone oxidoreductase subunit NuoH [Gemmatimonadaceae bacterium]|nr:NADH-quinone oxidoreductase subunit NuoH [Gemmatimonadaceae bacterium]
MTSLLPLSLALFQDVAYEHLPPSSVSVFLVWTIIKLILFFTIYMIAAALGTLAERKISAWIQDRHGPNRVGPHGLLQPAADGLKNLMKEESLPGQVNKPLFIMAPAMSFIPALMVWAVIPFGAPMHTRWGRLDWVLADLPVGFLFILAIASLGVYGIVLAGWASNNKYSLLGGLRSSAQMVSYEISMGMSLIPVLLLAGNVTLSAVVIQQARMGVWNALALTISFFIFMVSSFAETNRLPFDLPEAESELIAGYHSEYSAMKFSLFFIAEYCNMFTASAMIATLFFGGWHLPFTNDYLPGGVPVWMSLLSVVWFFAKILFFVFFFMWIRWTLPRFRYDQLMSLGWKIFLPLALAYIVIVASAVLALDYFGVPRDWRFGLAMFAMNVVLAVLVFVVLDRGRVISPASTRVRLEEVQRMRQMSRRRALGQADLSRGAGD